MHRRRLLGGAAALAAGAAVAPLAQVAPAAASARPPTLSKLGGDPALTGLFPAPATAPATAPAPLAWSGWESLGLYPNILNAFIGSPAPASTAGGKLDVFIAGQATDVLGRPGPQSIYTRSYRAGWGPWRVLSPPAAGFRTSAAATRGQFSALLDEIDLFIVGLDNMIYHTKFFPPNGGVSWRLLGGPVLSAPAVASWESGRLDVFAISFTSSLWHWFSTNGGGGWAGPEDLGGDDLTSAPAAVSWGPGRIDVFSRDAFGELVHKWYDGSWSGFENPGSGLIAAPPGVSSWGPGRLDVFFMDNSTNVFHKWFPDGSGGWSGQEFQGGVDNALLRPEAVSWGNNRIDVFTTGFAGGGPASFRMMHKWWQ